MAVRGRLSEPEDWFGSFWPPGQFDQQGRAGQLVYRPETGSKVRLIGGFDSRNLPVVHGSIEGVPITLLDCVATKMSKQLFDGVILHQDLEPDRVVYGINMIDAAENCFEAMEIELENLSQWSAEQDINLRFIDGNAAALSNEGPTRQPEEVGQAEAAASPPNQTGISRWAIETTPPDERRAELGDDITVELRRSHPLPNWDDRRDRTQVATYGRSFLRFSSTRSRTVDEWGEFARMAQDLLSLATFSPCAQLRQTLIPNSEKRASDPTARSEVHVYERQLVVGAPNDAAMIPWEMLFTLYDIDFSEVIPRWVNVRDMLRAACNMILGLKYIPGGYLETQLLTAVGAAEIMESSLARGLNRPLPVPKERFKSLRKELLNFAPDEYRDWLAKKLQNTSSLQDKLRHLVMELDSQIAQRLLPNVDLWAQRTAYARNDLAHRGESERVPPLEMSAAVTLNVAVVIITLLEQLKIPSSRVLQALERHPELKHAPDLARKYWPAGDDGQKPTEGSD